MIIHGTAKGGALSHKDFGVAFGGGGGGPEELFSQTSGEHYGENNAGTICGKGWEINAGSTTTAGNSCIDKTLTSFTINLKKGTGATGTLYAGVWSSSNSTVNPDTTFSGETNIANLTTSGVYYEYTGSHVLSAGDIINVVSTSAGWYTETAAGGGGLPASQDINSKILWLDPTPTKWWSDNGYESNGVATVE